MTTVQPKPPKDTGFPSTLTDEQVSSLKALWQKIDSVLQSNAEQNGHPDAGSGEDVNEVDDAANQGGKNAFKGVSKDDSEKEKQRREKEAAMTKKLLKQISAEQFRDVLWLSCQADDPDALILRFLRARAFDPDQAFSMLCASLQWRIAMDVPGIIRVGEEGLGGWKDGLGGKGQDPKEGKRFLKQYEIGKSFAYGTTLDGQPVAYIKVDLHYVWQQSALSLQRFVTHIVESGRMSLVAPAEQVLLIFDLSRFGISNMDYGVILFMMSFFTTYYPEALSNILVHKAPWIFDTIWSFLRPLIDQAIRDKVKFTYKVEDLTKYVDKSHLPDFVGGTAKVDWKYPGPTGPARTGPEKVELEKKMNELNLHYENATRKWIKSSDTSLGTERKILSLKRFLTWRQLDPYLRAPTVFQAQDVVSEYGMVTWRYKQADGTEIVEKMGKSNQEIEDEIAELEGQPSHGKSGSGGKDSSKAQKKDHGHSEASDTGAVGASRHKEPPNGQSDSKSSGSKAPDASARKEVTASNSHGNSTPPEEVNEPYQSGSTLGQSLVHGTAKTVSYPARMVGETKDDIQSFTGAVGRAHGQVGAK